MKKSILITGATGMLGSHLLSKLLTEGRAVRALYRSEEKLEQCKKVLSYYHDVESVWQQIEWQQVDLLDTYSLAEAIQGIEQVYHCAAMVSFDPKNSQKVIDTNVQTAANIVNVCLENGVKKLVHVSSVAALGRKPGANMIDEDAEWVEGKNNSAYAKSKYLSELEIWRGIEEGLNAVIVNPSIIMGAGNWDDGSAALFGRVAKGFKFYSLGVNAYVDARDVSDAMFQLMESDISSERYVMAAENKSYQEVFWSIAEALQSKKANVEAKPWMGEIVWRLEVLRTRLFGGVPLVTRETARTSHQKNYYNSQKIKDQLGFEFRSLDATINHIATIYKNNELA